MGALLTLQQLRMIERKLSALALLIDSPLARLVDMHCKIHLHSYVENLLINLPQSFTKNRPNVSLDMLLRRSGVQLSQCLHRKLQVRSKRILRRDQLHSES